jgi:hypothetical protein
MPKYRLLAFVSSVCCGVLPILGAMSGTVHGPAINIGLCTVGYVILSLIIGKEIAGSAVHITKESLIAGSLMAVLGNGGYYAYLTAFKMSPQSKNEIALITGAFPLVTILLTFCVGKWFGSDTISLYDWIAAAFFICALITLTLKPS